LLDCMMYEDTKLFSKALELLERNYTMRSQLIAAAKGVILLHRRGPPRIMVKWMK
jgi:hypothetical protein